MAIHLVLVSHQGISSIIALPGMRSTVGASCHRVVYLFSMNATPLELGRDASQLCSMCSCCVNCLCKSSRMSSVRCVSWTASTSVWLSHITWFTCCHLSHVVGEPAPLILRVAIFRVPQVDFFDLVVCEVRRVCAMPGVGSLCNCRGPLDWVIVRPAGYSGWSSLLGIPRFAVCGLGSIPSSEHPEED